MCLGIGLGFFSLQGDNEGLEVKGEKQVQAVGAKHWGRKESDTTERVLCLLPILISLI